MKAKRTDGRSGRFYTVKGVDYPSVTTILSCISKPALVNWAASVEREMVIVESAKLYGDLHGKEKISSLLWATQLQGRLGEERGHKKELAKAGEIGTQCHALIEWTLRTSMCEKCGPAPEINDKAKWAFAAWMRWKDKVNLKPISIETTVVSERYGFAGTMDLLAEVNGELTLLDWKTGKAIYPESFLQNAAYRHATRELGIGDPLRGLIVRLPKVDTDPEFEIADAGDEWLNFKTFLTAFDLWKWQQRTEEARKEKQVA